MKYHLPMWLPYFLLLESCTLKKDNKKIIPHDWNFSKYLLPVWERVNESTTPWNWILDESQLGQLTLLRSIVMPNDSSQLIRWSTNWSTGKVNWSTGNFRLVRCQPCQGKGLGLFSGAPRPPFDFPSRPVGGSVDELTGRQVIERTRWLDPQISYGLVTASWKWITIR